jgi:hypothetical protein
VNKASDADQRILMRWLFAAFSLDPTLAPLSKISAEEHAEFTKSAAGVYNRLLLVDCRTEALAALKNEGESVIGPAFGVLGQSTAGRILKSPAADEELNKLADSFDVDGMKKLFGEAGINVSDKK